PGFVAGPLPFTGVAVEATNTITVSTAIVSAAGPGLGNDLTLTDANLLLNADINLKGGEMALSGTISPGGGNAAIIHLSGDPVEFSAGTILAVQIDGGTAGTGYDQIQATGDTPQAEIDLHNVTLSVSTVGGFNVGQTFDII